VWCLRRSRREHRTQTGFAQERMIAVNITALTALTRLFLPPMLERGRGHILNAAWVTGFLSGPLMSVYFASKHYVLAFSEALIEELRGSGVKVTALCPPPVSSSFSHTAQIARASYMATTFSSGVIALTYWPESKE